IDWNGGIRAELARLFGGERAEALLGRYHELEPQIQADDPAAAYRDVMATALERLAGEVGLDLSSDERDALGRSLPDWPMFPEVPGALTEARGGGYRLVILSNSDPDLVAASIERIGVPFEDAI